MDDVTVGRGSASAGRLDWSTWPRYEAAALGFREYWYPALRVRQRTYPVEERLGWIWIYMGDAKPPPVETDIPSELLENEHYFWGIRITHRQGNWRLPLENAADEAHPRYLHRDALWQYFKRAQ